MLCPTQRGRFFALSCCREGDPTGRAAFPISRSGSGLPETRASIAHKPERRLHMKSVDLKSFSICNPSARLLGRMLAVSALMLGLSAIPASAEDNGCSDATLKGDYGWTIQGYAPNPDGTQSPTKGIAITSTAPASSPRGTLSKLLVSPTPETATP